MATATINVNNKFEFEFSYTFTASYSDTKSRVVVSLSSHTGGLPLEHPYSGWIGVSFDGESGYVISDVTITKSGGISTSHTTPVTKDFDKTHASASHTVKFVLSLSATDGSGASHDKSVTKTVTVPAKTSYKLTFNANGGSDGPSSQTKWYGESLTLTTSKPTRNGYTFSKWNTKSDGSGTDYSSGGTYSANAAATLYAQWSIIKYTITYNANGGSGAPSAQTKDYGATITLSSTKPTRDGYNFGGWNTKSDKSGTHYASGANYSANGNVTLYAEWTIKTYTVSFNANGGSNAPSSQTKTHGTALTLTSSKPTRTGYTFSHWDTKDDGSGTDYSSGGTYSANAAVTLYAQWNIIKYTITYNANGGSGAPASQTKNYGATATISSTVPTRDGYNFGGWNTKSDKSGTHYASGASYSTNANLALYAEWTIKTYTVSYSASGASNIPANQTKTHGTALKLSTTVPTKTNHVFKEWRTNSDGSGTKYSPGDSYTSNAAMTLYAQWYAPYTVSYNANGGSGAPSAQTKVYNQTLALSTTKPTRTNYVFNTWKATNGTTYAPGANYTANATTTLTAQWFAPYTVSYNANGGDGAPDAQTKIYNQTLTLTTAKPSTYKQNCSFNGWNTAANGSGTNYASGASYTGNANLTLYAKWTTAYASPSVTISKIYRADSTGEADDEGTYLALEASYYVYNTGSNSHSWSASCNSVTTTSPKSGGTAKSGTVKFVINANLSVSSSYSATLTLTDDAAGAPGVGSVPGNHSTTTASQTKSIGSAAYPIDIGKFTAGYGVAFNGVASRAAMDIGFADTHFGNVSSANMRLMAHTQYRDGKIIEVKANPTNGDGDVMLIGAGGPTFIGGGESDTNLYAALGITPTSNEDLYLASDGMIKLYTNCQTIANRKYCWLGTDGNAGVRQSLTTYSNNTDVVIGTSSNNGVDENKTIGSIYLRDNGGTWAGVFGSRTDSSSGDIHTYIGANNMKTDGTTVQAYLDVIVQKDGTKRYSVSDAGAFRNALGASSGVWPASQIPSVWPDKDLDLRDGVIDRDASNPSAQQMGNAVIFQDKNGERIGTVRADRETDGNMTLRLMVHNEKTDSTEVSNVLGVRVNRTGGCTYFMSDAGAFRNALGASSGVWPSAQIPGTLDKSSLTVATNGSALYYAKDTGADLSKADNGLGSSTIHYPGFVVLDSAGRVVTRLESVINGNGNNGFYLYARNYDTSGTQTGQKGISGTINKSGTMTYSVGDAVNFRNALGASSGVWPASQIPSGMDASKIKSDSTTTASDVITAASGWTINTVKAVRWGRMCHMYVSARKSSAITIPVTGDIENQTIGTLKDGYKPVMETPGMCTTYAGLAYINGDSQVQFITAPPRSSAGTIAANTNLYFRFVYILA